MIPSLVGALVESDTGHRWETSAQVAWVTRDIVLLLSGAVSYLNWRLTGSPTIGWYSALLTAVSIQLVSFDLLLLIEGADAGEFAPDQSPHILPLIVAPMLVLLAVRRVPIPARINPLLLGLTIAFVTVPVRLLQIGRSDTLRLLQEDHPWILVAGMAAFGGAACALMLTAQSVPLRDRSAGAVAGAVLVASHAGDIVTPEGGAHAGLAAAGVVGAIGVAVTSIRLCTAAARTIQASTKLLGDQVVQAEQRVLRDAEVLHELRATVAGVNKASVLLRRADSLLPPAHRRKLELMVEQELARMERLLDHRPEVKGQVVDLDDVIDPLVTAQQALGFDVRWEPAGVAVLGCPDDLAEAIHILLANAARHAGQGPTAVTVVRDPAGAVVIEVSDEGPGISEDVEPLLFERGVRAATSPGEGIGLNVARRLVRDQGGDLRLTRNERGGGSTFVLILPDLGKETAS